MRNVLGRDEHGRVRHDVDTVERMSRDRLEPPFRAVVPDAQQHAVARKHRVQRAAQRVAVVVHAPRPRAVREPVEDDRLFDPSPEVERKVEAEAGVRIEPCRRRRSPRLRRAARHTPALTRSTNDASKRRTARLYRSQGSGRNSTLAGQVLAQNALEAEDQRRVADVPRAVVGEVHEGERTHRDDGAAAGGSEAGPTASRAHSFCTSTGP